MNAIKSNKPLSFLLWFIVLMAFAVTGYFLHTGFADLDLTEPQEVSSDLDKTLGIIHQIDESYAGAIQTKADFRNMWSLIAIIAGALSAGAVAAKLPQPAIVTLGAFLAIVYGTLELQNPQAIIDSLANARNSLSCVASQIRELNVAKKKYSDETVSLATNLEPYVEKLGSHSVELDILLRRLNNILTVKLEEKKQAIDAIDNALMMPVKDNQEAINTLGNHLSVLNGIRDEIRFYNLSKSDPPVQEMLINLDRIESLLIKAIETLASPDRIKSKLRAGSEEYTLQLIQTQKVQKVAEKQLKKTIAALSKIEPLMASLEAWPEDMEKASASAVRSVRKIHSILLTEIAKAGPTQKKLAAIMSRMSPESIAKAVESGSFAPGDIVESFQDFAKLRPEAERMHRDRITIFNRLKQKIRDLMKNSNATLKILAPDIEEASKAAKKLEQISEKHLTLIEMATKVIREATSSVDVSVGSFKTELSNCMGFLNRAEHVIGLIDFEKLHLNINNCVNPSR